MEAILSAQEALQLVKKPGATEDTHLLYLSHELMRKEIDKLKHTIQDAMNCDCLIDFRTSPLERGGLDS